MSYSYQEGETTEDGKVWKCSTSSLSQTDTTHNGKVLVFGGPDNNTDFTRDQVNNVDFGITYSATASTDGARVRVNAIRVKVYYTIEPSAASTSFRQLPGLAGVAKTGDIIVAAGQGGHVIRSTDAGSNWSDVSVPFTDDVFSVKYLNGNFVITGRNGLFAKSTDLGATWTVVDTGTKEYIYNSEYVYSIGYVICGSNSTTTHSVDGISWRDISSQVTV